MQLGLRVSGPANVPQDQAAWIGADLGAEEHSRMCVLMNRLPLPGAQRMEGSGILHLGWMNKGLGEAQLY